VGDGLSVRGGAGSLVAEYEDMVQVAGVLDGVGDELRALSGAAAACAGDGDLLAGGVLSPGTLAAATGHIVAAATGPNGLLVLSVRLEANAVWVRATVHVYEAFDAAQAAALEAMQDFAGFGLGLAAWGLAGVGLVAVTGAAAVAVPAAAVAAPVVVMAAAVRRGGLEAGALLSGALSGELSWQEALVRLHGLRREQLIVGGLQDVQAALPGVGDWLSEFGGDVAGDLGAMAQDTLFEHPWITDTLAGGAEGLLTGLAAPLLMTGPGRRLLPLVGWPPATYEDAVASLLAAGGTAGWFRDGSARATQLTAEPREAASPDGIRGIFLGQQDVSAPLRDGGARLHVIEVPQPGGGSAWMVQIPGTQEWSPEASANPADLTTNLHLMAQNQTASMAAIESAMRQAGVGADDPVMLTGHSQGGITAASLASDDRFTSRYSVTHVVTGGSPVARFDIPDSVQVLSLEHHQDPVPRLEGQANPDRSNWTTVTRDVSGSVSDPGAAHGTGLYAESGQLVDGSSDASVTAFLDSARPFLAGQGLVHDYRMERR